MKWLSLLITLVLFSSCQKEMEMEVDTEIPTTPDEENYFPPITGDTWEKVDPSDLNWNTDKLEDLHSFLEERNTRAFIILKGGKIVSEKYWGMTIDNTSDFTATSNWYWASAGKTITACLAGIAQEQGLLDINDSTSKYLGEGWTSMSPEKENLITVRHQLTMTTGMDYRVIDSNCTDTECLNYNTDAGEHNKYTDENLENKIGMSGTWLKLGFINLYWSTARDAARFGHMILNEGRWEDEEVIKDKTYFQEMTTTSQDINPSYGYLWWLNGEESVIFPGTEISLPIALNGNAPADLFSGLGKNGQYVDVVPSMDLVVIRMGESPDDSLVPIGFHMDMWEKLMEVF